MATLCYYLFIIGLVALILPPVLSRVIPNDWPIYQHISKVNNYLAGYQQVIVGVVFVSNILSTQLLQTGAFEVSFNDELVYSKLTAGQLPTAHYLIQRLQDYQSSH